MKFWLIFILVISAELAADLFAPHEWSAIAPHLIPDTHPVKPALDRIFSSENVILTQESMKAAGFHIITRHWSDTVIATHKLAEGVIFKLFTDDQWNVDEVGRLLQRIHGALYAESLVDKHEWNKYFKVPRKWLYIVPGTGSKRLVLIAEDMRLLTKNENQKKWKDASFGKRRFKAVFQLLTEGGFSDSCYAFNLPFSGDGKIALIDNDHYDERPVPLNKLFKYLHPSMKSYAEKLMAEHPGLAY